MAKLITSLEELEAEIHNSNRGAQEFYHLHMFESRVEQWHKDGHWRFIRSQLRSLPHLKYACVKMISSGGIPMMDFYFFMPTKELMYRIGQFIEPIWNEGKKVPLVKCTTSEVSGIGVAHTVYIGDSASIAPCCLIM